MVKFFKKFTWKKAGKALKGLWETVIKPVGKPLLIHLVESKGNELGDRLRVAVDAKSPKIFNNVFDKGQEKAVDLIVAMRFVPVWMRERAIAIVQDEGDKYQDKLLRVVRAGDDVAFQKIFDSMLSVAIARIAAL